MFKDLEERLKTLIDEKTYSHSLRVKNMAISLGEVYGADIEKLKIAAILHDCGKGLDHINLLKKYKAFDIILDDYMKNNKELIHGPLGAKIAKEKFSIEDQEVLEGIKYHTTGRENMSIIDKIIYISDYVEPNRDFKGVEVVRKLAFANLDQSLILAMDNTIKFLIDKKKIIHPNTIKARNSLMIKLNIQKQ